jgi:hypothetical protein
MLMLPMLPVLIPVPMSPAIVNTGGVTLLDWKWVLPL